MVYCGVWMNSIEPTRKKPHVAKKKRKKKKNKGKKEKEI